MSAASSPRSPASHRATQRDTSTAPAIPGSSSTKPEARSRAGPAAPFRLGRVRSSGPWPRRGPTPGRAQSPARVVDHAPSPTRGRRRSARRRRAAPPGGPPHRPPAGSAMAASVPTSAPSSPADRSPSPKNRVERLEDGRLRPVAVPQRGGLDRGEEARSRPGDDPASRARCRARRPRPPPPRSAAARASRSPSCRSCRARARRAAATSSSGSIGPPPSSRHVAMRKTSSGRRAPARSRASASRRLISSRRSTPSPSSRRSA